MAEQDSYLYVEMWNAKPAWLALTEEERGEYMKKVDAWMATIMSNDCQVYGCCVNDGDTMPRAGYAYLVVWKLASRAHAKIVADGTAKVGFYQYFDQVNIGGPKLDAEGLIGKLMAI